jgi:hypothetical protein
MPQDAIILDAITWRPSPPAPATLEFALLAWDFERPTPDYEYEVELPEAAYAPMYVDFVSAAYAAALDVIGDLKIPDKYGHRPGMIASVIGLFPGTKRGTEEHELWEMAITWEFDTWLERILRINGGDVAAARQLIEDRCPVPDYVGTSPDLKAELLNYPDNPNAPDRQLLLRWMGIRGWNDDRIREIVLEHSIMLNDWQATPFSAEA